jgi:hypothetical protein
VAACWLIAVRGYAASLAADYFDPYATGSLGGAGYEAQGWAAPWAAGTAAGLTAQVVNTSSSGAISFTPSGGTAITGGARALDVYPPSTGSNTANRTGIVATRQLAAPVTGTFYAGYVVRWQSGSFNTSDTFALHFTNSAADAANGFNFGYRGMSTTYGAIVRKGTGAPVAGAFSTFSTTVVQDVRYLVAKFEKVASANYNKITLWVNPGATSEATLPNGNCQLLADSGISEITSVNIRVENLLSPDASANGNDKVRMDSLVLGTSFSDLMRPTSLVRPFIWVRDWDKPAILQKIAGQPWATSVFNGMVSRVAASVASHQSNRDTWLRQLPVDWTLATPKFKTIPAYSESSVRYPALAKFNDALDAAVLYYLTGDAKYARLAGDVLHNAVKTLVPVAPSTSVGNGGWIFQDDFLKEARVTGTQLPIVYDLLHPWLQANQVHDVKTAGMVNFNFTNAQTVFRTLYELCRDHGQKDSNWSALMATTMLNNLLALDSATERDAALQIYLTTGSTRQASLDYDYRNYSTAGNIWPESLQYATAVGSIRTTHMILLERFDPTLNLFEAYPNLPLSLPRIAQLRYPNNELILFGDGPRTGGSPPFSDYELVYQHALARGRTDLSSYFGSLINGGVSTGGYNRSALKDYASLGNQDEPLQLLWQAPAVTEPGASPPVPRTDTLPFAGIALQRNPAPASNATFGLMAFVGGAGHVHSHASGMSMELFGMGQVLGAKSGRTDYGATDNENYYRVFASNNTVIVNGGSRGLGGWQDIAINTVQLQSMEPAAGQPAVSPYHSYSSSSFVDDKGTLAQATQQRTLGIVRTSPTTGYYVDIFRSDSSLSGEYHDYIYRNVGDSVTLTSGGSALALTSAPTRFQSDIGDSRQQPGWRYFQDTEVSATTSASVHARFTATISGTQTHMQMFMPGAASRQYARVTSPPIVDAPSPYHTRRAPTLTIRRTGEAWNQAFAAVFEPYRGAADSGSVTNVTKLEQSGVVVGLKVNSTVGGKNLVQHVLSNATNTASYTHTTDSVAFTGRYAVVTNNGDGTGSLYLGLGTNLSFNGYRITSTTATQAYLEFAPAQDPVVTANGVVTVASPLSDWRLHHFGSTANTGSAAGSADPDGDGANNTSEYILGTVPRTSDVGTPLVVSRAGGSIVLTFVARAASGPGYAGLTRYYDVENTVTLGNSSSWVPLDGHARILAAGQTVQVTLPATPTPRYFRLRVRLE